MPRFIPLYCFLFCVCSCGFSSSLSISRADRFLIQSSHRILNTRVARDTGNLSGQQTRNKTTCRLRPYDDPNFFLQFVIGHGWMRRPCAVGTWYTPSACKCNTTAPIRTLDYCRTLLYIPFTAGSRIQNNGTINIAVGHNNNINTSKGYGEFKGNGQVTIWMYSDMDLGQNLEMSLKFFKLLGGSGEQVLISNCYDNVLGSIEIVLQGGQVVFRGNTTISGPVELRIPYQETTVNTVQYSYNGAALKAAVNNQTKSTPMQGDIVVQPGFLRIGMCNRRGYVGRLDEVRVCQVNANGR